MLCCQCVAELLHWKAITVRSQGNYWNYTWGNYWNLRKGPEKKSFLEGNAKHIKGNPFIHF